jgi:hypothetical protein
VSTASRLLDDRIIELVRQQDTAHASADIEKTG